MIFEIKFFWKIFTKKRKSTVFLVHPVCSDISQLFVWSVILIYHFVLGNVIYSLMNKNRKISTKKCYKFFIHVIQKIWKGEDEGQKFFKCRQSIQLAERFKTSTISCGVFWVLPMAEWVTRSGLIHKVRVRSPRPKVIFLFCCKKS